MTNYKEYMIDGIRVESTTPAGDGDGRPPIIFVHGGCHGSWSWEKFLPYFAAAGWECHALNWHGHNGSEAKPKEQFVKRSIADVVEEISVVASGLSRPPVVVGHSMGGLASQKYAEQNPVAALVLTASVVPAEVAGMKLEFPVDMNELWGPPPFEDTLEMFFQGLTRTEAEHYYALLCRESPQAVFEATRCTVSVDKVRVSGPVLVLGAELDIMTPPHTGRALADFYGADYRYISGRGHNLLLEPRWEETAAMIADWLKRSVL